MNKITDIIVNTIDETPENIKGVIDELNSTIECIRIKAKNNPQKFEELLPRLQLISEKLDEVLLILI